MSIPRSTPLGVACLLFAALACADPVVPAAPAALRATLHSLWEASPEIAVARAQLAAARASARAAAQPVYNPELELAGENADVDRRTLGLGLALDLSGKRGARAAQGEAELAAAQAAFDLQRRDVAARWLKAWSAATFADRELTLGERRVALMRRFDELAAKRLAVGDISSPERDLAGLATAEAQAQQASLAGRLAASRAALAALGADVAHALPEAPAGLPPSADDIVARADDTLPESTQALALQTSAEAAVDVARRARIPDPTLRLTGGRVHAGAISDTVVGVSVSIPLPVRNSGSAEVEAARARADAAAANAQAHRLATHARLGESRARYAALREAAQAFRAGRAGAFAERTALLENLWRAGEIGTSDYLVQLKQSLDTALSGFELEDQAWQAWFDHLAAAGRLIDWVDGRTEDASP